MCDLQVQMGEPDGASHRSAVTGKPGAPVGDGADGGDGGGGGKG